MFISQLARVGTLPTAGSPLPASRSHVILASQATSIDAATAAVSSGVGTDLHCVYRRNSRNCKIDRTNPAHSRISASNIHCVLKKRSQSNSVSKISNDALPNETHEM